MPARGHLVLPGPGKSCQDQEAEVTEEQTVLNAVHGGTF